ncbi:protein of unknown function [Thauera humireducens]|nr:protein of unknown function [Thauera humireducens]
MSSHQIVSLDFADRADCTYLAQVGVSATALCLKDVAAYRLLGKEVPGSGIRRRRVFGMSSARRGTGEGERHAQCNQWQSGSHDGSPCQSCA